MKTITLSSNDRLITKLMVIQDNLEEFLSKMEGTRHRHEKMKREIPWEDIEYLPFEEEEQRRDRQHSRQFEP